MGQQRDNKDEDSLLAIFQRFSLFTAETPGDILQNIATSNQRPCKQRNSRIILSHELMPVPLSIAELNGSIRTGNKSVLIDKLTDGINCPESIDLCGKTACLIIDSQALVVSLGKPNGCSSFGDLADIFVKTVFEMGRQYQRMDVVFDRYRPL